MSAITRFLIKIARVQLEAVRQTITQQLTLVQDEIDDRLRDYLRDVVNGVWTGKGADAFIAKLEGEALPLCAQILDDVRAHDAGLVSATNIMDEADMSVRNLVNSLGDTFSQI